MKTRQVTIGCLKKSIFRKLPAPSLQDNSAIGEKALCALVILVQVKVLFGLFTQCQEGVVISNEAQEDLGVSWDQIDEWLRNLELSSADFLEDGASVLSLVFKSRHGSAIREFMEES